MTDEYLAAIEQELKRVTLPRSTDYAEFFNLLHYHLGWTDAQGNAAQSDPGKRIRPLLCLWTCQAVGTDWQAALPAAAALELIHNFSLIHDDIQDNSEARRGRPALWKVWGLAQGINAGDAMFVLAQQALDDLPAHLSLERFVGIHRAFNSAILKLTQGQYLDLAYERADQVTLDQYFEMVRGKTAALLSAACEIGARHGTADPQMYQPFATYGQQLGIAFQIADDVLGLWGDPRVTGKPANTDLLSRKKSYPVLYAMETDGGTELRSLYAKQEWSQQDFERVNSILDKTNARSRATKQAEDYARQARNALDATGLKNPAITRLHDLVHQVVYREK